MQINIDTDSKQVTIKNHSELRTLDLYGREAFELISDIWLKTSWNQKYSYTFTWLGRPIIQHPEDLIRLQEVIYTIKPDVIIETGVAHGGSLIFYAGLFKAMGHGRSVIGVDLEIRPHNREAIEKHELSDVITLIEGNSVDPSVVGKVSGGIQPQDIVMVVLDSNHSKSHVMAELQAYHHLVTSGSYILATDGIMRDVWDVPHGNHAWRHDNPATAAKDFILKHSDFVIEQPKWHFNESDLEKNITTWPCAWLRRLPQQKS